MLAGVAAPFLPKHLGPLAIAQARRPRPVEEVIPEPPSPQALHPPGRPLQRSKTVAGDRSQERRVRSGQGHLRNASAESPGSPESDRRQLKPTRARPNPQRHHTATPATQLQVAPIPGHRSALGAGLNTYSSSSLPDVLKASESGQRLPLDRRISSNIVACLLYTSPSPRDRTRSRMPSSA